MTPLPLTIRLDAEGSMLGEVRAALQAIVDSFDASAHDAAAALQEFAAIERLAAAGKLLAARYVADPAWLARETGVSYGQARATLEAAQSLTPAVETAVRAGTLSEAQTRELAPAVAADPSAATTLLTAASSEAFGKLKERCARVRHAATDDAARDRRVHDRRSLRVWQDATGAGRVEISGPAPVVARFRAMLEPHREAAFRDARTRGRGERSEASAFDGFARWLDAAETPRRRRRRNPDAEVIVLVDATALRRGTTEPGETCEIAGLGPVSVAAASELLGDALLSIVVKDAVDVRSVVHTKRTINGILQTALLAKGWRCSTPACPNVRRLERDHVQALCLGGWTALAQLDLKCRRCHGEKTARDLARLRGRSPC